MQEEEAAESQRRFDAAQAAHDQALSEIQSKCDHYEHLLNNAQAELEQYQQQQLQQVHLHQMAIAQQQQLGSQGGFPPLLQGGMNGYIPPYMMGAPHQAQGFTNPQGQGGPFMHQDPTQAFQQHPGSFTGFNSNLMDMTSTMMHGGPPPGFSHPQYPPPHQYPPSMMTQDPGQVLAHPGQGLGLGSGYGNNPNDLNNPPHSHSTMMMMATANVGGAGPFGNPPGFNGPQGGQVNPPRVQEARADRSTLVPTLNPSLMGESAFIRV